MLLQRISALPRFIGGTQRLNVGYVGPILQIYNGTTVQDVASVNAIAAFCGSSNGFVSKIYDQSGNARDFSQATVAARPKIYDGASTSLLRTNAKGPAVMRFDGVDDYVPRAADGCGLTGSPSLTYWQLAKSAHVNGGFSHWGTTGTTGGDLTPQYQLNQFINGSDVCRVTSGSIADHICDSPNMLALHDDIINTVGGSSANLQWFMNGAIPPNTIEVTTGTPNLNNAAAGIGARTAGNLPLNGDIAFIGMWSPQLGAADIALLKKFGQTWRSQ
jgi:hypothetical protein